LLKRPRPPRPYKPPGTPGYRIAGAFLFVLGLVCLGGGFVLALAGTGVVLIDKPNNPLVGLGVLVMALGVYLIGAGLCQLLSSSKKEAKRCLNWLKNWPPKKS